MFQSSPGFSTGCNGIALPSHDYPLGVVSILTRLLNRMQRRRRSAHDGWRSVSILTRLLNRMQQDFADSSGMVTVFQSSPGFSTGCNNIVAAYGRGHEPVSILTRLLNRMQPLRNEGHRRQLRVSILTRLLNRMQPAGCDAQPGQGPVSILTRLLNRMQRGCGWAGRRRTTGFNPHPASQPDATFDWGLPCRYDIAGFNPHPASQPDATISSLVDSACSALFQSSPGFSTGCNEKESEEKSRTNAFQSSPGFSTGCNTRPGPPPAPAGRSFNPHPASQPDATYTTSPSVPSWQMFQSSPGFSTGCNAPTRGWLWRPGESFNPHPASQPDATCTRTSGTTPTWLFQSSPGFSTGCNLGRQGAPGAEAPGVSILTRLLNRMQPPCCVVQVVFQGLFQSSPGFSTGCNLLWGGGYPGWSSFNPHPASQPDATPQILTHTTRTYSGFNPHPASQPDATILCDNNISALPVSILTRLLNRMQPGNSRPWYYLHPFQSSPGFSTGCNSFNSRMI